MAFLLSLFLYHHLLLLLLLPNLVASKCPESFQCGDHFPLHFPFTDINYPKCGLFKVEGCNHSNPVITFEGSPSVYQILAINSPNKIKVLDYYLHLLLDQRICFPFTNTSLPKSPSYSLSIPSNLTLFTCSNHTFDHHIQDYFKNYRRYYYHTQVCEYPSPTLYYLHPTTDVSAAKETSIPANCALIQLPINSSKRDSHQLFDLLTPEFTLEWSVSEACYKCYHHGGQCLHNTRHQFICKKENARFKKITFIGGMTIAALTSALITVYTFIWRKRTKEEQELDSDIELFLKNNGNVAPMRYKYSTIKKMTNSFSESLGRGGFGSVYKGWLPDDGHPVAVKVLNESKNGNGEDFMNEVACISRTSHINIVALLGYCFEGSKRILIYDFMPNGSLEKFIVNNASSSAESGLGWDKLFEISLGIARGLEYLHQGCNTRILHLDIKPQNILLDKDMNPRISDFGLAKLCPNRSSVVSMIMARGTIGYIAPEVFSRSFGEVSYRSDVYSYGMLVLEMVGGRRRSIDPRDGDCTSETYFPHYLYKQLEMNVNRDGDSAETIIEEDEIHPVKRNLIIVGLWCIQTNPKDRPSMTKVVEMLEGKVGSLEVPPKPYLYSPPRSPPSFSTSEYSF